MMNSNTFREIVELLSPLMENQTSRESLVYSALLNEPIAKQIDFSGATHDFVIGLVKKLDAYGTISTGELALVALLNAAKEQVGFDKRQQIDKIVSEINQSQHDTNSGIQLHPPSGVAKIKWQDVGTIVAILSLLVTIIALPPFWREEATPTPPPTATLTLTSTPEPTATMTDTATNTPQPSATETATSTDTPVPTSTNLPTATDTPEPTKTTVPTVTNTPMPPSPVPNISVSPTNAVVARTYPCGAEIVFNSTALLNVVRRGPAGTSSYAAPIRQGSEIIILSRVDENRTTYWYQIADSDGNQLGWISPNHVILSASCPTN